MRVDAMGRCSWRCGHGIEWAVDGGDGRWVVGCGQWTVSCGDAYMLHPPGRLLQLYVCNTVYHRMVALSVHYGVHALRMQSVDGDRRVRIVAVAASRKQVGLMYVCIVRYYLPPPFT